MYVLDFRKIREGLLEGEGLASVVLMSGGVEGVDMDAVEKMRDKFRVLVKDLGWIADSLGTDGVGLLVHISRPPKRRRKDRGNRGFKGKG